MSYMENFAAAGPVEQIVMAVVVVTITVLGPLTLAISCWRDWRRDR
jgi:hypothetical protein